VVARLHNYLATMERLHLATRNVAATDASQEPLEGLLADLRELGDDMDVPYASVTAGNASH
jgi:hypothetical protein